jgi:uncharacterized protein with HEPN domain
MRERANRPRLLDIIEAIERIRFVLEDVSLESFEVDWQKRWLVERGMEIISEASRRLTDQMKGRRPEVPWQKVAGIGNILRHEYENVSAPVIWALGKGELSVLESVCRDELAAERGDGT